MARAYRPPDADEVLLAAQRVLAGRVRGPSGFAVRSAPHGFGLSTNLILLSLASPLSNCEQVEDAYFFGF